MKQHPNFNKLGLAVISALALPATANAAGFAVMEGSVSGLGNAFAGGSAVSEDASTIHYNPAGMSRLQKNQVLIGAHQIQPEMKFTNDGSQIVGAATVATSGGNGGDAGLDATVPNLYYMNNINSKLDFGLGITAPFGLTTEYNAGWVGRYHALKSELITVNVNPALSFKVNDKLSLGFGLNYQTGEVNLTSNIDQPTLCAGLVSKGLPFASCAGLPEGNDGYADIKGDSTSWGVNFGLLYQFSNTNRLGFAYRSNVRHELEGTADFSNIHATLLGGSFFVDTTASATLNLPAIWSLSYFHSLNDQWDIMADYTLTEWSTMEEIRIDYNTGTQGSTIEELKWEDASRMSIGATFHASDALKIRMGYALDESPVTSIETASARVPDADRTWLTLGAGYALSNTMSVDVGYAMIDFDDTKIDRTNSTNATLTGSYKSEIQILSAQLNMNF